MATQQGVIQGFMNSLDTTTKKGETALDAAIKAGSSSNFSSFQDVKTSMINDCTNANKNGEDFLKIYCGIDLDNDDTGAITGWDAGGSTVKTKNSIVPESGSLKDPPKSEFSVNGFTIKLADKPHYELVGNDNFNYITYEELPNDTQKYIWQALNTWWASGALDLISESYGDNFGNYSKSTTVKEIAFGFVDMNNSDLATTSRWTNDSWKTTSKLSITVNMKAYNSMIIGNKDGKLSDSDYDYLDRVLAHEFTHAVMSANINNYIDLPQFVREGMAELTHGIDDERGSKIEYLSNNATELGNWLDTSNTSTGQSNAYAAGYMFFRYLARQAGDLTIDNKTDSLVKTFKGNDNIKNYFSKASITSGAGSDTVYNYSASVKADGEDGNDLISNDNADKVTMIGGAGNDTLWNWSTDSAKTGGKNVLIDGSSGNDTIWNDGSSATINGGAGNDTITNSGSNASIIGGAGNDTVYNYAASVKADGEDGNDLISNDNADKVTMIGGAGNDTLWNWSTDSAKTGGKNVLIDGSSGNDTIWNDGSSATINGGAGNDTITNSGSNASIIGGAGNDTVYNYGDTVTIDSGTDDDYVRNGSSSYVKIDGNTGNDFLFNDSVSSNVTMIGGTGNDTIWNWGANVTISGGKGNDEISNAASTGVNVLFSYATGDGNDLIKGFNTTSTLSIDNGKGSYSSITNNGDYIVTVGDGKITLVGAESLSKVNILGKNNDSTAKIYTNSDSSKVTLGSGIKVGDASTRTKAIKITGNTLNNTILGGSGKNSLYGADGNDYLEGGKSNDRLYGQNGNDTLWGGKGNDTLKGGDGDDLFIYSAGNDVISDYAAGDKISLSAAISKSSIKGSDATFTIGSNTLTVKDSFGEEIVFIDANGKERTVIGGAYLANNSSSAKSTLSAWREVADASERTKAIRLTGNTLDNSILGGTEKDSLYGADGDDYLSGGKGNDKLYGQNGDDTLWGGIGNDTLKGGDGADVFIYNSGEGKDVITDFANDDLLQITGTFSGSYNKSAKTVAFKVGSTASAITLKDFTATIFNVNGYNYKISGSTLVKK